MFILKKVVSEFLQPLPLISFIFLIGLMRLLFTKKQGSGKLLVSAGFIILLLASNRQISNYIIGYLEHSYRPQDMQMSAESYSSEDGGDIKYVVVLGAGHTSTPGVPLTSRISETTMVRLIEGIRLHRKYADSKLLLSGGRIFDEVSDAELMADIARELGVNDQDILLETESMDTGDEARLIREMVGSDTFILVTSASHMYRSMAMFRKIGMDPIPAPVGHQFRDREHMALLSYLPSGGSLHNAERAAHEYLGMVWASLRGQI